ncbi:MAG TPA: winged helix-turn-helix domain-containing protein [Solirubrobacterales bacterium]|nr:winged helix-turn-helix domain-containing protein [Solirubrobacterales bacterium]
MNRSRPNRIDQRLVRALGHPLRVKILEVVQVRNASPSELTELLAAPLGNVAYHVRVLEKCGCIEQVATARRRGAVEHYFRARPRSYIGHQDWRKVPKSLRDAVTGSALGSFFDRAADALEAGTMDAHDDTTLNWMPMAVDEAGWAEVAAVFQAAGNRLEAIHALCRRRMEQSGEEATPLVVGMAAFEPAPEGWSSAPAGEVGGAARNGAGPSGEAVGEGEAASA